MRGVNALFEHLSELVVRSVDNACDSPPAQPFCDTLTHLRGCDRPSADCW